MKMGVYISSKQKAKRSCHCIIILLYRESHSHHNIQRAYGISHVFLISCSSILSLQSKTEESCSAIYSCFVSYFFFFLSNEVSYFLLEKLHFTYFICQLYKNLCNIFTHVGSAFNIAKP